MSLRDARVVVLGAGGFIGRWVARRLTAEGAALWCAVRDPAKATHVFAQYHVVGTVAEVDVLSQSSLAHLLQEARPHVVFNLVGYGVDPSERDPAQSRAINVDLVRDLLELVPRYRSPEWTGAGLVHTGSALEYGDVGGELREDHVGQPTSDYGTTKLAGTQLITSLTGQTADGLRAVVARLFTVYGPGEHPGRLLPTLLEAAQGSGRVALTSGTQLRDFTYVEDVAEGLVRLAKHVSDSPAPHLLNLATGKLASVRDFIISASHELGIAPERLGFGEVPQRPEEIPHATVTVDRLRSALGWIPSTQIREGVRATARFIAADGSA